MLVVVSCVVEGKGEEQALPVLVRRLAERVDPSLAVNVPRPVLLKRNRLADFEHRVQLAINKTNGIGGVLILLDADKDCPKQLGPALFLRAAKVCGLMPCGLILAKVEYESCSWQRRSPLPVNGDCRPI
jgi:hypothetical protein